MPSKIKPRRSYTANSVPLTTDLETHELAINWTDSKAFTKNAAGQIVSVTLGGGSGSGGSSSANIVEATTAAGFPATGASGTLYVATDASRVYRWTGSVYVEIGTAGGGGTDSELRALFVPAAPTSVTATGGNAQAVVSWTAPSVLAQTPITDYTVQFSTNSGSTWTTFTRAASTATSATVTGLTNGTAVVFRVSATNGVGIGNYSTASSAVTPAAVAVVPVTFANKYGGPGSTYSITGTSTVTAVLNGNAAFANDNARLWMLINVTGTLSYTVTASSEASLDIGRLHISSASPATNAAITALSSEVSGTQTTSGTASVTAGQHLVLVYSKDSEDSALNDRVTATLSIA
jgi:titin